MTRTIISLIFASVIIVGAAGIATWTLFTDTEESTDNQLITGTLDLRTDDADGVTQTLYATNLAPGDTVGPATIVLSNTGTIDGTTLDISFSYVENDVTPNLVNMTADEMAAMIEVTTLNYDVSSLLSLVNDDNSNGYVDVYDLMMVDLSGRSGITTTTPKNFAIAVQLRSDTGNYYQADGITVTMTFVLNQ
jgi:predicted ribosomally synthesized peptide with SipW-like signal peptide